jgi:site-specific DNA-adenine methylase
MFYYYGAKNTLSRYYPSPQYQTIVEPFGGSAAYSCYHLSKDENLRAIICEKNPEVCDAWEWLMGCSEQDVIDYPTPEIGEQAFDFLIKTCSASNASAKCKSMKFTDRVKRVFEIQKRKILKLLPIRDRITFIRGDFRDLDNYEATWFIDPPYQVVSANPKTIFPAGDGYAFDCGASRLDFGELANYCKSRNGQVIVCEKNGATWMDFQPFHQNKTSLNNIYKEVIWYKSGVKK